MAPPQTGLGWSNLGPRVKPSELAICGHMGVLIGTQDTVLIYIIHTGGPHIFSMYRTCKECCAAYESKCISFSRNASNSAIKLNELYGNVENYF